MAIIHSGLVSYKLFVETDVYFHTVDNRPLWELAKCQTAINDEFEDVKDKNEEIATFMMETPATGTSVGGVFVCKTGGTVKRVVLSQGTGGSSSDHVVDVNIDGTTCFTNQGNRPVLAYNDSDGFAEVSGVNVEVNAVPANGKITVDVDQVQAGSPVWLRVDVFIQKTTASRDVADYSVSGDPSVISYTP